MSEITRLAQQPSPGNEIELFDLDLSKEGGSILRFTNWTTEDHKKIVWRGHTYQPIAMEATGYGVSGEGKPLRPRLRVANGYGGSAYEYEEGDLSALMASYKNFVGATVRRWKTYRQFLDDGTTPDPSAYKDVEDYTIGQMLEETNLLIEWELNNELDQEDNKLPRGIMTQKYCRHTYRVYDPSIQAFRYEEVTCPYGQRGVASDDTRFFDENNQPTTKEKDECSQRIEGCRLRFGLKDDLPFWGYPGMVRVTRRS